MNLAGGRWTLAMVGAAMLLVGAMAVRAEDTTRSRADQLFQDKNFAEAYELYRKLALGEETDPAKLPHPLERGVDCLNRLDRANETEPYLDEVLARHPDCWQVLHAAAGIYHRSSTTGGIWLPESSSAATIAAVAVMPSAATATWCVRSNSIRRRWRLPSALRLLPGIRPASAATSPCGRSIVSQEPPLH